MIELLSHLGVTVKPITHRFLTVATLTLITATASAAPLTEEEAVFQALLNGSFTTVLDAHAAAADAATIGAGRWSNPQVSWSREQLTSTGSYEDIVGISQQIDISGRLGLEGDAAQHDAKAVRKSQQQTKAARVAQTRHAFFALLFAQERHAVIEGWRQHLVQLSGAVRARANAGDAADYEARRLEAQLARVDADLVIADTEREAAWVELAVLMGKSGTSKEWPRVAGTLLPETSPADGQATSASIEARGDVQALAAKRQAANARESAAGRWWVPRLTLQGGFKGVSEGTTNEQGFVAGVGVELPLFDRAQGEDDLQAAIARHLVAQETALKLATTQRLRQRLLAAQKLITAAQQMNTAAAETADALARTAQQTYLAGELSVVELLDAHQNALETKLDVLALALRARHAVIEIDKEMGVVP